MFARSILQPDPEKACTGSRGGTPRDKRQGCPEITPDKDEMPIRFNRITMLGAFHDALAKFEQAR